MICPIGDDSVLLFRNKWLQTVSRIYASNCGTSVSMIEKYYSDARPTDFMDRLTKSRYANKPSRRNAAGKAVLSKNVTA